MSTTELPEPASGTPSDTGAKASAKPAASGPKRVRLADFEKKHMAGAGNWLYEIPWEGGKAVLKVYFGTRNPLLHVRKSISNALFSGRSSHMPRARCQIEKECLEIWGKHGFEIFGYHPDVIFEDLPEGGYLLFDYTTGTHFREYYKDTSIPMEERMATWRRFLKIWHRRHALAIEHSEPRLIHENGDVKHVLIQGEGEDQHFVSFDFEIVFRSRDLRDQVGREILAYLRSCGKFFGEEIYQVMLAETVKHYPDPSLLFAGWEHGWHNRNPLIRFARKLDRALRPGKRKRFSKYSVAAELKEKLDAASLTNPS